jgi:DNA ligase-1
MFKPLLSPGNDPMKDLSYFQTLKFPLLCSPKLDGIRCIIKEGQAKSRTYKNIPNLMIQDMLEGLPEFDGELIDGDPTALDVYNKTQSTVMSIDKDATNVRFYVFDYAEEEFKNTPFWNRLGLSEELSKKYEDIVIPVKHKLVTNLKELLQYENEVLELNYEGVMMRDPNGIYKYGRATWNEGIIYKLKRFTDDEAVIIDILEQMTNNNEKERDELGKAKRSTAKAGLSPADTLGKIVVNFNGLQLDIAPGTLNHIERQQIWDNKEEFIGKYIKFRHFAVGVKELPRFPRFVGFRDEMDFGELK